LSIPGIFVLEELRYIWVIGVGGLGDWGNGEERIVNCQFSMINYF